MFSSVTDSLFAVPFDTCCSCCADALSTTSLANIGPLENHVFTISANNNASYYDEMPIHLLSGMKGKFHVIEGDAAAARPSSIPGPSPQMQDSSISKDTGNSTGVPATSPIMHCTSDRNGDISLVGSD